LLEQHIRWLQCQKDSLEAHSTKRRKTSICADCQQIQLLENKYGHTSNQCYNNLVIKQLSAVLSDGQSGCPGCKYFAKVLDIPLRAALKRYGNQALNYSIMVKQVAAWKLVLYVREISFRQLLEICPISVASIDALSFPANFSQAATGKAMTTDHRSMDASFLARVPRAVSTKILSEETRNVISGWMTECSEHDSCCPPVDQELPTRVLDITDTEKPILIESKCTKGTYVILSHCWGDG
jgi:hypothetical protein